MSQSSYHTGIGGKVLAYLAEHPGSTSRQIAEALGYGSSHALSSAMQRLRHAGHIEWSRQCVAGCRRCYLAGEVPPDVRLVQAPMSERPEQPFSPCLLERVWPMPRKDEHHA